MGIKNLFHWLKNDEESFLFSDQTVTQELLKNELLQAEALQQQLIREVRVAKFSKEDATENIRALEQHERFMHYLQFCKQSASDHSLLLITLNYLLSQSPKESSPIPLALKVKPLFLMLLQENQNNTLDFYEKNKILFKDFPELRKLVAHTLFTTKIAADVELTKKKLMILNDLLMHQKNPFGIVGFFRAYIGDTEQFAALILWLLARDAGAKEIIQTGLLHDFLKYHFFTLHEKDNEVVRLYAILECFPQTKELLQQVRNTASDERGLQQYSLDGVRQESELHIVALKQHPSAFSLEPANFFKLHQLIGFPFLAEAVISSAGYSESAWLHTLKQALNTPNVAIEELSKIIHLIATDYSPSILKNLAGLIDDLTIQELLSSNEGSVLYLIPYKSKLLDILSEKNSTELIEQMVIKHPDNADVVYQIAALFMAFSKKKHPATPSVFQALIDSLIRYPHLLEDDELLVWLKKYPDSERLLLQRYEFLVKKLNDCIVEQIAELPFSSHHYHMIEDCWSNAIRQCNVLALITSSTEFNLDNKYVVRAKIAAMAFALHGTYFDLDAFLEALSLPPVTSADAVSEYERVLIELLVTIDNERLRTQIIYKLENHPIERSDWMKREYEGNTIFCKAAKAGNLGLIKLFESELVSETVNEATLMAAREHHWLMVDYLVRREGTLLTENEVQALVLLAAQRGEVTIIHYLYGVYDFEPSTEQIAATLEQAIINNNLNVLTYFYQSSFQLPKQAVINSLFHLAIEKGFVDVLSFLADAQNNHPTLSTVERVFEQATLNQQLRVVEALCNLSSNTLRPEVIERAFIKACQQGFLTVAQYFYNSLHVSQAVREDAFKYAVINKHSDLVIHFCNSLSNPPKQSLIEEGLFNAAKTGNIALIEYFCAMSSSNKPNRRAISQALVPAIEKGHTKVFITLCDKSVSSPNNAALNDALLLAVKKGEGEIVHYLCERKMSVINSTTFGYALVLAVQFRQPEIVRYLCELNVLEKASIRSALNKAIDSKQIELVAYLREQLKMKNRASTPIESIDGDMQQPTIFSNHGFFKVNNTSSQRGIGQSNECNNGLLY